MATDNNINNYTAADIEKYHKGLLSAKERHALEKAALDDPFLADALEGYAVAGADHAAALADLQKRLGERTRQAKVIPLQPPVKKSYSWMRVAAMLVILIGAAVLARVFLFTGTSNNDIAKNEKTQTPVVSTQDTRIKTESAETTAAEVKDLNGGKTSQQPDVTVSKTTGPGNERAREENTPVPADDLAIKPEKKSAEPAEKITEKIAGVKTNDAKDREADLAKNESLKEGAKNPQPTAVTKQKADRDIAAENGGMVKDAESKTLSKPAPQRKTDLYQNQSNIFRGRVTDASNTGLPFANVTNTQDNVGTYTDARGYFNLTSPDSVLNVQIRSLGFEDNNVQLRNSSSYNQVVMQNDRRNLSEVVISNKKPNTEARSRNATLKIEEPEPADGWDNYDTYLANNLKVPEDFESRQNTRPAVEVSFEIDKNGEPVNIKVEKSLCSSCDKEAIRLIKEGPKWKRKAKKGRASVTVSF
jgi:hypothetical protein